MLSGETSKGSRMQQSPGGSTGSRGFWRNLSLHLILQGALEHGTSAGSDLPCSKVSGLLDLHLSHWILVIKLGWVDSQALRDKETPVAQTSCSSAEASGVGSLSGSCTAHGADGGSWAHGAGKRAPARSQEPPAGVNSTVPPWPVA